MSTWGYAIVLQYLEDEMLSGFGIFAGAVGVILSLWFVHVGFLVKKLVKEQQETNRLLGQLVNTGPGVTGGTKAA